MNSTSSVCGSTSAVTDLPFTVNASFIETLPPNAICSTGV
jgi:hypothetical protein